MRDLRLERLSFCWLCYFLGSNWSLLLKKERPERGDGANPPWHTQWSTVAAVVEHVDLGWMYSIQSVQSGIAESCGQEFQVTPKLCQRMSQQGVLVPGPCPQQHLWLSVSLTVAILVSGGRCGSDLQSRLDSCGIFPCGYRLSGVMSVWLLSLFWNYLFVLLFGGSKSLYILESLPLSEIWLTTVFFHPIIVPFPVADASMFIRGRFT